jgi:hypothetical protein
MNTDRTRSEFTANYKLAENAADRLKQSGWQVGKNFFQPLPQRKK